MDREIDELLKEIKAYRNDMVAKNYPHQQISDIITKWEKKNVRTYVIDGKDFYEENEKEKKKLKESYKESVRQANERKK
tara:strand:- start:2725 stop:2961 length:237 start_codon:yes stop_codon:yes gene_type:complete